MKVMKFGGSSVKDAEMIRKVADVVINESLNTDTAVVLSAMKGITDALIEATLKAEKGDPEYKNIIETILNRQKVAIEKLIPDTEGEETFSEMQKMTQELTGVLHGIELVRECSPRSHDLVVSFGERFSCRLFADYLRFRGTKAEVIDARQMIRTDDSHMNAGVFFEETYKLIQEKISRIKAIPVITGFIASTENGVTTTLGRNGSDYTASLVGAAIGSEVIEIWTDVDGVLSADPRTVKNAFVIPEISIQEAMELSYFGAEVIHPYTMIPAVEKNIPIRIKNTLNPQIPGTIIAKQVKRHNREITGIASIDKAALINIEGGGMIGIPGIASRVFNALGTAKVNIIMISQASSEHSICVVVREKEAAQALAGLKRELKEEMRSRRIQNLDLKKDLEIIAIIGENMRGTPGISGKLFSALGENGINVLAIAQGSSELNISFVIEEKDREKALNVVHEAFLG